MARWVLQRIKFGTRTNFFIFYFLFLRKLNHFPFEWWTKSFGLEWWEKTRKVNARVRDDEKTVTKRSKSVIMSRKTKSVNLQFYLDFVGSRWRALYDTMCTFTLRMQCTTPITDSSIWEDLEIPTRFSMKFLGIFWQLYVVDISKTNKLKV